MGRLPFWKPSAAPPDRNGCSPARRSASENQAAVCSWVRMGPGPRRGGWEELGWEEPSPVERGVARGPRVPMESVGMTGGTGCGTGLIGGAVSAVVSTGLGWVGSG